MEANKVEWLEPWASVADPTARRRLEQELLREVADGHTLFGRPATAVAARCDCDDVLFMLEGSQQLAVVHLSYAAHPDRPPWPTTEVFKGLQDFVERRMKPDHADYAGTG